MSQIIHSRHTHAKMLSPAVTERLLTRMGQHVSPQMISRRKRIITLGADECVSIRVQKGSLKYFLSHNNFIQWYRCSLPENASLAIYNQIQKIRSLTIPFFAIFWKKILQWQFLNRKLHPSRYGVLQSNLQLPPSLWVLEHFPRNKSLSCSNYEVRVSSVLLKTL